MQAGSPRIPLIDVLKATSCLLIVSHHLAWYGPMSDYAYPLILSLINWLCKYGRIVVQVFFVTAGFLSAKKFAPEGISLITDPFHLIKRRYLRLVIPYLAALTLAIGCAALARAWMVHDSTPNPPNFFSSLRIYFCCRIFSIRKRSPQVFGMWRLIFNCIPFLLPCFGSQAASNTATSISN